MKEIIRTSDASSVGPYSQATVLNGVIYVSGQLPIDPKTKEMVDGVGNQTKQALENIESILKAGGSDFEKVSQVTVLLSDMGNFADMNTVYTEYLKSRCTHYPARMCYAVKGLPKNALVEIACTAGC